jgi:hypothetical protein
MTHAYIHTHYGVGYRFDPEQLDDVQAAGATVNWI